MYSSEGVHFKQQDCHGALRQSFTLFPLMQETPQLAEWCGGKLHHMIVFRKILTAHYLKYQSAVAAKLTDTHMRAHTESKR